jgi:hypothetical protein
MGFSGLCGTRDDQVGAVQGLISLNGKCENTVAARFASYQQNSSLLD